MLHTESHSRNQFFLNTMSDLLNYNNNNKNTLLINWMSLWWIGVVPLLGIGALSAAENDWKDQFLKESWIYSVVCWD